MQELTYHDASRELQLVRTHSECGRPARINVRVG